MAEKGRGKKIPRSTQKQIVELYCEKDGEGRFLYSLSEIGHILDVDRKTAAGIVRQAAVEAMLGWPHELAEDF